MNIVINKLRIWGPVLPVFDLVTTARFWPQWLPSTISVTGVVERPYLFGDSIRQVTKRTGQIRSHRWTVIEHLRPNNVVLQMHGEPVEVRYTFIPENNIVRVVHRLSCPSEPEGEEQNKPAETQLFAETAAALQKLKVLIESTLRREIQ